MHNGARRVGGPGISDVLHPVVAGKTDHDNSHHNGSIRHTRCGSMPRKKDGSPEGRISASTSCEVVIPICRPGDQKQVMVGAAADARNGGLEFPRLFDASTFPPR